MDVLLTGAHGRVGGALKEHLATQAGFDFTYLDRRAEPDDDPGPTGADTHVADIADYEAIRPAFDGVDAVVHLAAYPTTDGTWEQVHRNNLVGTQNVLRAASEADVSDVVFASSIHAVGMYEEEAAPAVYERDHDLTVTHEDEVRPDSYYGASKAYGEDWGRFFVECHPAPERFYAVRIASVRAPPFDHPYGDAERGVYRGDWDRGSDAYETKAKRLKGTWLSRRDCARLFECCLRDETVRHGVFFGTSDNERSWYDIDHAREVLGYDPEDRAEDWTAPPEELRTGQIDVDQEAL